jgi:hypothetical protein
MRNSFIAVLCLGALSASGCRSADASLGMTDTTYVNTLSELKAVADDPALSDAVRTQRRDAVFRKYNVRAEQLEVAARALANKPDHAMRLWRAIDTRAMKLGRGVKP